MMNKALFKHISENHNNPLLFLDKDAFYRNLEWIKKESGNKKIRIATKSIRSLEILKLILNYDPIFQGLMTFTLEEALWLRSNGFKNILMGYPTSDESSLETLAKDPSEITLMVDRIEHIEQLNQIALKHNSTIQVCIDLDMSLDLPGVRFGVYRSHLHTDKQLKNFIKTLKTKTHLKVVGAMGYEAQIAGMGEKNKPIIKSLKSISISQVKNRRKKMIEILKEEGVDLEIINGGGTGSLKTTRNEEFITEITVGSGIYASTLFDEYEALSLTPSLYFALPVIRKPNSSIITVLGGGYIASGATDAIKQPKPIYPEELELIKNEGAGEVQTPLQMKKRIDIQMGNLVIFRHAKAGEICERFKMIRIFSSDQTSQDVSTYRGDNQCFL